MVSQVDLVLFQSLGNSVHSTLNVSSGRDTKNRWLLLPGVCAIGSKNSHTGKWKNPSWTHRANGLDLQKHIQSH